MENNNLNNDDRREKERVSIFATLKYKGLTKQKSVEAGIVNNISERGIKFQNTKFIPLGCLIGLSIYISPVHEPIKAVTRIVWIKKQAATEGYDVGSKFIDMTDDDKVRISDFLRAYLSARTA